MTVEVVAKAKHCGAALRTGTGTCRHEAGWGTPYPGFGRCKVHGGCTPTHLAAAREAAAAAAVVTYGLPRRIDPFEALTEELHRAAGHVAWLERVVRAQDPEALVWGTTERTERGSGEYPGADVRTEAKPSVWLEMYLRERRHMAEVAKTMVSLGIDERRVRVAERQAVEMFSVFAGVLSDVGVDLDDPAVVEALERRIRAVTGGAPVRLALPGVVDGGVL